MPNYVDDPDKPGSPIDVVELQSRNPLQVLPPVLLEGWMKHDTWSRREALMLLAGYNPNVTQWTETAEGFGMFSAGSVGYLDKLSESIIRSANVSWRHPRYEEALHQFWTLSDYASGSSLDERKTPDEWTAWAASKGFSPYWADLARSAEMRVESRARREKEHQYLNAIGSIGGFSLHASPVINGNATISVGAGEVIQANGMKILYSAASISISHAAVGMKKRVYLHDPGLANGSDRGVAGRRSLTANCDDDDSPRGVYEGGLIVAGHIVLIAHSLAHQVVDGVPGDQRPVSRQAAQNNALKKVLQDLGYNLHALPKGGPGKPGPKKAASEKLKWTNSIFNKAWERLRKNGDISDA